MAIDVLLTSATLLGEGVFSIFDTTYPSPINDPTKRNAYMTIYHVATSVLAGAASYAGMLSPLGAALYAAAGAFFATSHFQVALIEYVTPGTHSTIAWLATTALRVVLAVAAAFILISAGVPGAIGIGCLLCTITLYDNFKNTKHLIHHHFTAPSDPSPIP